MIAGVNKPRNRSLPLRRARRVRSHEQPEEQVDSDMFFVERNGHILRGHRAKTREWVLEPADIGIMGTVSAVELMDRCEVDDDLPCNEATSDIP